MTGVPPLSPGFDGYEYSASKQLATVGVLEEISATQGRLASIDLGISGSDVRQLPLETFNKKTSIPYSQQNHDHCFVDFGSEAHKEEATTST